MGSTLVPCLVCQLPLTRWPHCGPCSLHFRSGCPAVAGSRRRFCTELVSARTPTPGVSPPPPPNPSHLLVWLQKPFSSSSTGLPVWLTVGELEHGAGRAAEILSLTHCFCAGQVLAAPREMRRLPPMCSCAPLCWSIFYDHQKLCTGQSHKGSGEQLIGKLPLHHPQIPAPGPSQGQGDCQGQGRQAGITHTASPLHFPNQGIPVPPSPGHSPKS